MIIYKFTQENLGAQKIARSRFQSPVKKKIANCDIGNRQRDPWIHNDYLEIFEILL
jgi:hypothetical protein